MSDNDSEMLGQEYPMTDIEQADKMKDRILLETTIMFAQNGYSAVSIRDIAKRVDLSPASLYNYYACKEDLWDAILAHIKTLYSLYFDRLDKAIRTATDFSGVLTCMFIELKDVVNIYTYYGFSLIQIEQFRDEKAYEIYQETFLRQSIDYIKSRFDDCIEKGWANAFDTLGCATSFMHSVLTGITVRVHEDMGDEVPYDVNQMFDSIYHFILQVAGADT